METALFSVAVGLWVYASVAWLAWVDRTYRRRATRHLANVRIAMGETGNGWPLRFHLFRRTR